MTSMFAKAFNSLLAAQAAAVQKQQAALASLTQFQTNGLSLFGTLQAPTLPFYLGGSTSSTSTSNSALTALQQAQQLSPLALLQAQQAAALSNSPLATLQSAQSASSSGAPWGLDTTLNTNPYTNAPRTGIVRYYNFNISRINIAPDGYQKSALVVNGAFPGPLIEANWGDTIQVTVTNSITGPQEGTALHWHGLLQTGTPYYDGVPSVHQCPIAPGASFTYSFSASLYGSTWYHSHYSSQYAGGLWGPMVIHGPSDNAVYDIDIGPVALSDYYHDDYFDILSKVVSNKANADPAPLSDNNLINGKGNFDCTTVDPGDTTPCVSNAGIAKFQFQTGKTHRLRIINTSAEAMQRFSIDGHNMTVMANDFVPIVPYTTNVITLGVGQRTDVLVTANQGKSTSAWYMRSSISTICSLANQPNALAAIYYDQADTTKLPTSTGWNVPDPGTCANDPLSKTVPSYSITPDAVPATTRSMDITFGYNSTGFFLWQLDGVSQRSNYNNPVLGMAALNGSAYYPPEWNVKNFGTNKTIRVVVNNLTPVSHPMHLHGHNMFVLAEGVGTWDGVTVINPANPQRRDVQLLRPNGYMVWQINADNPGVWPFHCHIAWHASGGLYANILERPQDIVSMLIPSVATGILNDISGLLSQTCNAWNAYTGKSVVEQIDSGV